MATPITAARLPAPRTGTAPRDFPTPIGAAIALAALALLPWAMDGGASALGLIAGQGAAKWPRYAAIASLAPVVIATLVALVASWLGVARITAAAAGIGLAWAFAQGFHAGTSGPAFGVGATVALTALTVCLARTLGRLGLFAGNATIATIVVTIGVLLLIFIFYPIGSALVAAFLDAKGNFAPQLVGERLLTADIWGLGCFGGGTRCGVAINSALLATIVGVLSTLLGLALALVVQRGGARYAGVMKMMSVLPVITPPFVVALALVVLFGRTGLITSWLEVIGIPRSRWIYGLPGVAIAQLITFTPISFMLLHGALHAISPALEEAAQTLRASRARVFGTVTWPLLRPALANAFLLAAVESLADFGNPIVLAGNFEVLSTKIFFAVAGAQYDAGRAAVLAIVLLALTLLAFFLQQRWIGRASYVTVTGKGDGGASAQLPRRLWIACFGIAAFFIVFTLMCYAVIATGGFVRDIGRGDMTPSFRHFLDGFRIEGTAHGLFFSGSAWDSFFTTIEVALVSAPLTAIVGLLSAYVITRHRFAGRRAFEFLTLVSFAVPGTVIGVSYIVAFNVAPLELTGGMAILVLCFVFRNMPVGVRSGVAALAQIDRTLDEASATLRASTWRTLV
ncbi:MAG TPA: iron ABC transporter permease, partial [Casimicrobiaceae bacterium]